jgi:hypothetical protein
MKYLGTRPILPPVAAARNASRRFWSLRKIEAL